MKEKSERNCEKLIQDSCDTTNREIQGADPAKIAFLNNMSHDIRTPMNAIIGFANIAMKYHPDEKVNDCLEKISQSAEHLLALMNDVLDISRIESGKIKYMPVPVDICTVTDAVLEMIQGFLSQRDLTFVVNRKKPEYPYVIADPVRIREVLVNILSNAVKFTDDGGKISFATDYDQGADDGELIVRYSVTDTGIGMSEEYIGKIFEEFSQEEPGARTQYKGTGLGMAITKRYVDLMGGTIFVESKKGVGSRFQVELPLKLTDRENVREQDSRIVSADLTGVKILLAEDNDLNAEIVMTQLEEYGIQVTRVNDGKEAVAAFAENPAGTFDLILMDIMMPVMNGYDAAKEIRSLKDREDADRIPIIAMTANAFVEDIQATFDSGMNAHIAKPIVMDEVIKIIADNLYPSGA